MNIFVALGVSAGLALLVWLFSSIQQTRHRRALLARLRAEWAAPRGHAPSAAPPGVYHRQLHGPDSGSSLDAATWSDLNLESVFRFMDRTESALGREVLYDRLRRTDHDPQELRTFDATVERFRTSETARHPIQRELAGITEKTSEVAWQLVLERPEPLPRWMHIVCPAFLAAGVGVIVSLVVEPATAPIVVPVIFLMLWLRAKIGWRLIAWVRPFQIVGQILRSAGHIAEVEPAAEPTTQALADNLPALSALRRMAGWIGRDESRADLAALLAEYVNWVFCLDGNVLLLGIREARRRQPQLRAIAEALGYLDASIAIASVRAGAKGWVRPTFAPPDGTVELTDLRHPLVPGCVPNTLAIGPPSGIILTGANMTGKSTFLRTVGTNVVLAQTIHTAFAAGYEAPVLAVRTCISPSDDLEGGKSLYQREAETVVSIMDHAARGGTLLCLFDELFRGTNSADRIGASAAVLSHLARNGTGSPGAGVPRCLVIAATHDLELVTRLDHSFRAFHFGDRIAEDRLQFDYRLHPGVATSRNAVALLRLLGAPEAVVLDAMERAGRESPASGPDPAYSRPVR